MVPDTKPEKLNKGRLIDYIVTSRQNTVMDQECKPQEFISHRTRSHKITQM